MTTCTMEFNEKKMGSTISDYWFLLKPRIMYLVVFTGMSGIVAAPGYIHPFIAFVSMLCIAIGSGAASVINMWYDSDIDLLMNRTKNRPIPSGKVLRSTALEFGVVLSIISVYIMAISVNYLSAFLLLLSIFFYVFVYTIYLKRRTPQNIVIGGAAGAFPPIIGWVSVTGAISFESLIMFVIIFLWTPPHFWALSLLNCDEYRKAKVPMMPLIHGVKKTKYLILFYSIALVVVSLLPAYFVKSSIMYEVSALILGAIFLLYAVFVFIYNDRKYYKKLFSYSITYLFMLFLSIIVFSCY